MEKLFLQQRNSLILETHLDMMGSTHTMNPGLKNVSIFVPEGHSDMVTSRTRWIKVGMHSECLITYGGLSNTVPRPNSSCIRFVFSLPSYNAQNAAEWERVTSTSCKFSTQRICRIFWPNTITNQDLLTIQIPYMQESMDNIIAVELDWACNEKRT